MKHPLSLILVLATFGFAFSIANAQRSDPAPRVVAKYRQSYSITGPFVAHYVIFSDGRCVVETKDTRRRQKDVESLVLTFSPDVISRFIEKIDNMGPPRAKRPSAKAKAPAAQGPPAWAYVAWRSSGDRIVVSDHTGLDRKDGAFARNMIGLCSTAHSAGEVATYAP